MDVTRTKTVTKTKFAVENFVSRVVKTLNNVVPDLFAVITNASSVVPATLNAYLVSNVIKRKTNVSQETSNV